MKIPEHIRNWCIEHGFELSPHSRYIVAPPEETRMLRRPYIAPPKRKPRAMR